MSRKVSFDGYSSKGVYGEVGQVNGLGNLEKYTTGFGGDMRIRLGQVQGIPSFDHNTVSIKEPLRIGRFIACWLRVPPLLSESAKVLWDYMLNDSILEFSGLQDNDINTIDRTQGGTQRVTQYAGMYKENNGVFSLKIPEYKGSPFRKLAKYVAKGISDNVTNAGHFHGHPELRYNTVNYGGDFFYALMGPSGRPDDIEYACVFLNSWFGKEYLSHLNSGMIGDAGGDLTFDAEFKGTYVANDEVNALAMYIVEALGFYNDSANDVILPEYLSSVIANDKKLTKKNADGTINIGTNIRTSALGLGVKDRLEQVRKSVKEEYPVENSEKLASKIHVPAFGSYDIIQDGVSPQALGADPVVTVVKKDEK